LQSEFIPVVTHPIPSQMLYKLLTVELSIDFSATLFSDTTTQQSLPFTPKDVSPELFTALNAYST